MKQIVRFKRTQAIPPLASWRCRTNLITLNDAGLDGIHGGGALGRSGQRRMDVLWDAGARETLFENVGGGVTVDQFLDWFPGFRVNKRLP